MRVMLINPPPEQFVESYDTPDYGHIGLAYVAGALEQQGFKHGEDLFVVDAKLARWSVARVLDFVKKHAPDVVGLSAYTFDILYAGRLARRIKEIAPHVRVIVGGVHSSAIPAETLDKIPEFDIAMVGECEATFPELLGKLEGGAETFEGVGGVAWREDGEVVFENATYRDKAVNSPVITRFDDLDDLPFPAWHMFPQAPEYQVFTARGCPRACVFCMSPYGRKTIREMSPERVLAELDWIVNEFGPREIRFNDETLAFNPERMHAVLDGMGERGLGTRTRFFASMRADKMTLDLLQKMKRVGFYGVEVGVETGDVTIMRKIKKGETLEETREAVAWVKEADLEPYCGFIIGHPGETPESAWATVEFAAELNPHRAAFGLMVPYPGTEVAHYAQNGMHGYKLLSLDWSDYNKQYGNALELEGLPRHEMERIQAFGYLRVYLKNWRLWDCLKFAWTYRVAGWNFVVKQLRGGQPAPEPERGPLKMNDPGDDFRFLNYRT